MGEFIVIYNTVYIETDSANAYSITILSTRVKFISVA